jgi:replicative DNA helicase
MTEMLPPNDLDAERCTLASLAMGDAAVRAQILAMLDHSDFYLVDHEIIFQAIRDLLAKSQELDLVQLVAELRGRKLLDEIGGVDHLRLILDSVPSAAFGQHYAEIVRDRSLLRRMIVHGGEMIQQAYAADRLNGAAELLQKHIRRLGDMATQGHAAKYRPVVEILMDVCGEVEKGGAATVPFGVNALDRETGGVAVGEMVIVAARPSMGKSTLLRQIAVASAKGGVSTGFISLEEGEMKVGRNVLAAQCGIENHLLRHGSLVREQWDSIFACVAESQKWPLYFSDTCRRIADIRAMVSLWVARHGVKLVLIDYLQRIRGSGKDRYEQVSNISLELSDLFKEAGVAGVVAAQLNRATELRADHRPTLSDLRDSGQLEQDADGIIFLHREDYYHLDEAPEDYQPKEIAEFIIGKWRDGRRGNILRVRSNLRNQRFLETVSGLEGDYMGH